MAEISSYKIRGHSFLLEWWSLGVGMFVASCSVGWFISSPILPFVGFVKCNLNAAIFAKQMRVGFGFAIRDNNGGFVVCMMVWS